MALDENSRRLGIGKLRKWVLWTAVGLLAGMVGINGFILVTTKSCLYRDVQQLPARENGLLLGTDALRRDGTTNVHFVNRVNSAVLVLKLGKIKHLIISGDRNNRGFNEVQGMQRELIAHGVSKDVLTLDFEGFRTWESARRAREVYHLNRIVVITDEVHAPRSVFLCRHFGMDAVAFCGRSEPNSWWAWRYRFRECLARVKAVMDLFTHCDSNTISSARQ